MYLALITFSIYISFIDLNSHKISNKSIFLAFISFSLLTLLQSARVYPATALFTLLSAPFILRFKIGAGDIKLFAVLSLFFLPISLDALFEFVSVFSIIAALLIVFTLLKERTLQSSIALAPAICGAFIWCAS